MAFAFAELGNDPSLRASLDDLIRGVSAQEGSLLLADDEGQSMHFVLSIGPSAERLVGQQINVGQGLVGLTMAYQIASSVADVKAAPAHDPSIDQAVGSHTEAMIAVPVSSPSREWGVLTAINPREADAFTPDQLESARSTAAVIAERLDQLAKGDDQP